MKKKSNSNIIHDISLLYELSLAIGNSFDLKENIHKFSTVLMSRLNIDIVTVWLKDSVLVPEENNDLIKLIYSNPIFRVNTNHIATTHPINLSLESESFESVSYLDSSFTNYITESGIHNGVYTVYKLADIGFIKFYQFARKYAWTTIELHKLEKVISAFAQSIIGCLNHDSVIRETEKRNEIENSLLEKENEFLNLINTIEDVFWVYNPEKDVFNYISPTIEKMFDIDSSQLYNSTESLAERIEGAQGSSIKDFFNFFDSTLNHDSFEFSILTQKKNRRWIRCKSNIVTKKTIGHKLIAGIFTDITTIKKAQKENEFRIRFEEILLEISTSFINLPPENINDSINLAINRIGDFSGADRCYIFEFSNHGKTMSNTYEWCASGVTAEINNLQNLPSNTFPWWMKQLNQFESIYLPTLDYLPDEATAEKEILGAQNICSLIVIPLAIRGNLKGFIGFDFLSYNKDISEETLKALRFAGQMIVNTLDNKHKEQKLKYQQKRYQSIVETATDIIYRLNKNGQIVIANDKLLEHAGISKMELIGMNLTQLVHPNDAENVNRFYRDQLYKGIESTYLEFPVINRFGEKTWFGQNASLTKAENGEPELTIVARDITDIKMANEAIKKAYQKADKANKSKSQFIINTSHEIRTPTHAIKGLVKMLEKTTLNKEQKEIFEKLNSTTNSLGVLINNIIDFKHLENDSMMLKQEPFNLQKVIHTIFDTLKFATEEKNVNFSYHFQKGMHLDYIGDAGKLMRVLINLAENAIKFNDKGTAKISISSKDQGKDCLISFKIIDTGVGIDPEIIEEIDQFFDQEDNSLTRKYEGAGLGLFISIELIKLMKGTFDIKTEKHKGTEITFSITLKKYYPEKKMEKEVASDIKTKFPDLKMLIVEDNKINQLVASSSLKSLNISYEIANNGKEAIELIKKHDFDAILMDLMMPVMDGFEATKIIREELKLSMPIIACTAKKVKGTYDECIKIGMNGFISKPFGIKDVRKELNDLGL